jgi:hypothetical protein
MHEGDIDWSRAIVDSCSVRAMYSDAQTGPNPPVRAKRGSKRHPICDARQVQDKVDAFSTKARGVKDDTPAPVVSNFRGTFKMRDGVIHFSKMTFAMPGAHVSVSGRFVMESEALDSRGIVRLEAKLSQLTTGVKSFFPQDARRAVSSRRHHRRADYHRGHGRPTKGRPRLREGH